MIVNRSLITSPCPRNVCAPPSKGGHTKLLTVLQIRAHAYPPLEGVGGGLK